MARINIDDELRADPRFTMLCTLLPRQLAFGSLICLWEIGQAYWKRNNALIPKNLTDQLPNITELVRSGFVEISEDGGYCMGANERWAFLTARSDAGKKSAERRREKYGTATPCGATNNRTNAEQKPNKTEPSVSSSRSSSLNSNTESRVLDSSPSPKGSAKATFAMTESSDFTGLMSGFITKWVELYNAEYINREVNKAIIWLNANPQKNKKTVRGWVAFYGGWFDRGWAQHTKTIQSNKAPAVFDINKPRYYD